MINIHVLLNAVERVIAEAEMTSTDTGFIISAETLQELKDARQPWVDARDKTSGGYVKQEEREGQE